MDTEEKLTKMKIHPATKKLLVYTGIGAALIVLFVLAMFYVTALVLAPD